MNEIESLYRETMDFSDKDTMHFIVTLEADHNNQYLVALTSKLYDQIQAKVDKIDFSTVEASRGDITKVQNYNQLVECIDIIRKIIVEYKQPTEAIDCVSEAINNIKDRSITFKKAFVIGAPLPKLLYNSMVMAIVQSVSFLISSCVEYVKDPSAETFQMALDVVAYNKTKENLMFNNLRDFNKACKSKDIDNALDMVMKKTTIKKEAAETVIDKDAKVINHDSPFLPDDQADEVIHDDDDQDQVSEGVVGSAVSYFATKAMLVVAKLIIPIIRSVVYYFYYSKQKMSDYYATQADLIEMNAYKVQYNNSLTDEEKKKVFDKQMKMVTKFRKRSNGLNIDYNISKASSTKLDKEEAKKFKADDIDYSKDDTDEDTYNKSSLF